MPAFDYKPRTLRDQAVRVAQTADETDKSPKVELEEKCGRCGHQRFQHCFVRRTLKTRSTLFVLEYGLPNDRQLLWERTCGTLSGPRDRRLLPVRCKHADGQADFPCCTSTSCVRKSCDCVSFKSPFAKPKKAATAKTPGTRKKRATKPQQQLDFEPQDDLATPHPF